MVLFNLNKCLNQNILRRFQNLRQSEIIKKMLWRLFITW